MRYLLFILFPLLASAQPLLMSGKATVPIAISVPSVWYPTNISTALAWWDVNTSYVTNGSIPTLTDLYTNHWDLTNAATSNTFPKDTGTTDNGLRKLWWVSSGVQHLKSVLFTNHGAWEMAIVASITNRVANAEYVFDSANGSFRNTFISGTNGTQMRIGANGTYVIPGLMPTNKWTVFNVVINGSSSTIYTNNTAGATVTVGSVDMGGLTIGNNTTVGASGDMAVAELAAYSGALDATSRSNLFNYFTNKYAITP